MDIIHTPLQLWILAFFVLILFEMGTPGLFYFLSFACGALGAGVLAWLGCSLTIQLYIFLSGSIVALGILRKWVKRLPKDSERESNVYALIGKKALVTKEIVPHKTGQVKILGQLWVAQGKMDNHFKVGNVVVIKHVTGVRLIVEKID